MEGMEKPAKEVPFCFGGSQNAKHVKGVPFRPRGEGNHSAKGSRPCLPRTVGLKKVAGLGGW